MTGFYDIIFALAFLCYFFTMFKNPGVSTDLKLVDPSNSTKCNICTVYKPGRALHCPICNKCVLRMENHCIWTNSCIGYYNFKACILMCFYFTICGVYHIVTGIYLVGFCKCRRKIFYSMTYGFYLFLCIIYIFVTLLMLIFDMQYITQITHNITTMERLKSIGLTANCFGCKWVTRMFDHPYNLGWVQNFERMFSRGGWYSLLPFTDYKDFGFDYNRIPSYIEPNKPKEDKGDYLEEVTKKYKDTALFYMDLALINNINQ